ncbi:transcription factor MAMYB [Malania oleifera]|uniref:transcription factor MAMYB n=1 Tax=Malania oleifera TaxID=397392 RepID=UPI0025AE89D1|nr:transcription factor MAMYB [Malania oleifera]
MEFLDEEPRPRFFFQSRATPSSSLASPQTHQLSKPFALFCFALSISLFLLALFFLQSQTLQFLILWSASSLLLAPFAPDSLTGGDIRVGQGPIVEFTHQDEKIVLDDSNKKVHNRKSRPRRSDDVVSGPDYMVGSVNGPAKEEKKNLSPDENRNGNVNESGSNAADWVEEEKEWNDEDFELLKKQMMKHPVGKARRWEIIAEAFRGRHKVESVIKTAKALGEKRAGGGDSYAEFLKNRKPLNKRIEGGNVRLVENGGSKGESGGEGSWCSGEDIALLNALKAFPKDASMRWENIAAAVPGRSKAACMKRVSELKKDFRSSKASSEA